MDIFPALSLEVTQIPHRKNRTKQPEEHGAEQEEEAEEIKQVVVSFLTCDLLVLAAQPFFFLGEACRERSGGGMRSRVAILRWRSSNGEPAMNSSSFPICA